jgi:hypothetical protein
MIFNALKPASLQLSLTLERLADHDANCASVFPLAP